MPLELDPFKPGENNSKDDSPFRKWMSKKEAMRRMDVGKTLFTLYKKVYGLKTSKIGHKERVYEDDLHDFYMRYRK